MMTGKTLRELKIAYSVVTNSNKPVLAIDFDNTLFASHGKPFPETGDPIPGAKEALDKLKDKYTIRIYSCRTNGWNAFQAYEMTKLIKKVMRDNNMYFDDIVQWNEGKIFADYYIDDRAVEFNNDWKEVVDKINQKEKKFNSR